jgi:hypothetical protein
LVCMQFMHALEAQLHCAYRFVSFADEKMKECSEGSLCGLSPVQSGPEGEIA